MNEWMNDGAAWMKRDLVFKTGVKEGRVDRLELGLPAKAWPWNLFRRDSETKWLKGWDGVRGIRPNNPSKIGIPRKKLQGVTSKRKLGGRCQGIRRVKARSSPLEREPGQGLGPARSGPEHAVRGTDRVFHLKRNKLKDRRCCSCPSDSPS